MLPDRPFRRDLCESAKRGKLCCDDLCHTGGETLCGFDLFDYQDMLDDEGPIQEDYNDSVEDVDEFNRKTGGGVW